MTDQFIINSIIGIAGFLASWAFKSLFDQIRSVKEHAERIDKKLQDLEVQVAGHYVTRAEMQRSLDAIFQLLRDIDNKLAGKADR